VIRADALLDAVQLVGCSQISVATDNLHPTNMPRNILQWGDISRRTSGPHLQQTQFQAALAAVKRGEDTSYKLLMHVGWLKQISVTTSLQHELLAGEVWQPPGQHVMQAIMSCQLPGKQYSCSCQHCCPRLILYLQLHDSHWCLVAPNMQM